MFVFFPWLYVLKVVFFFVTIWLILVMVLFVMSIVVVKLFLRVCMIYYTCTWKYITYCCTSYILVHICVFVQVLKAVSSPEHPWHQFGTGNAKTLRDDPKEAGVDVRAELLEFHGRYYSANLMRLAVLGRSGLDELQKMVVEKFSPVSYAFMLLI